MADKEEKESGSTEWMQKLWRPAMGWMYMLICLADMIVFPVLWSLLQAVTHSPITQWNPLTLQGAGLFHIAMGAVLGISAFGRTQEKLAGTAVNPSSTTGGFGNGNSTAPATGFASGATTFGAPAAGGFGGSSSFGSTAPSSVGGGGFGGTSPAPATSFTPPASWGTTPIATTASGKKVVPDFDQPAI
jgi:hypothetical protein